MRTLVARIRGSIAIFELRTTARWIVFGIAVGLIGGLAAIAFNFLLGLTEGHLLRGLAHVVYPPSVESAGAAISVGAPVAWLVLLLPALGGLVSGLLVTRFAPEAEGHGTDSVIAAYHRRRGVIRGRVPIVKLLASTAVIGTGGSAGREGPVVQTASGFASVLAQLLHLSVRERRLLVLAGVGAGVGGMFRAPLGGALFAAEVLYRSHEIESEAIIPAAFASIVAYTTTLAFGAPPRLFDTPDLGFVSAREIPAYLILALVLAVVGVVWIRYFYGVRDLFRKLPIPAFLKPALGGLGVGALALVLPQVMGGGYGFIQETLREGQTLTLLLLLVAGKIVATGLTVGSGGSGGVFAPSVFIGAMLGGATAAALGAVLPATFVPRPEALIIVGMGGFFGGIAKVPVTSLILVAEMTGDYNLFLPMLLVSAITSILTGDLTIYEAQAKSVAASPAHEWEFRQSLLDGLRISDCEAVQNAEVLAPDADLGGIMDRASATRQRFFPVVSHDGRCVGGFDFERLRSIAGDVGTGIPVIAADIADAGAPTLAPDDDLHSAMARFTRYGTDELPIVSPADGRFVGLIGRREIMKAYERRLALLRAARDGEGAPPVTPTAQPGTAESASAPI